MEGLPDRYGNPKPGTQLLLARNRGIKTPAFLFFHPPISFHELNPTGTQQEESQSDTFCSKLEYQEAQSGQAGVCGGGREFVGCGRYPVSTHKRF